MRFRWPWEYCSITSRTSYGFRACCTGSEKFGIQACKCGFISNFLLSINIVFGCLGKIHSGLKKHFQNPCPDQGFCIIPLARAQLGIEPQFLQQFLYHKWKNVQSSAEGRKKRSKFKPFLKNIKKPSKMFSDGGHLFCSHTHTHTVKPHWKPSISKNNNQDCYSWTMLYL